MERRRSWIGSWPVYRQLTGTDRRGLGAAAKSDRSRVARTSTADQVFMGNIERGRSGEQRPGPTVAPASTAAPAIGSAQPVPQPAAPPEKHQGQQAAIRPSQPSPAPGFSF